jgi:hypothetical protein
MSASRHTAIACWLQLALALVSSIAHAHEPGMVELTFDTPRQTLRAELDLVDVDYVLGLDDGDGRVSLTDVGRNRERIAEFVAAGVEMTGCRIDARQAATGVRADATASIVVDMPVACGVGSKALAIGSSLFADLPGYRSVLLVKSEAGTQAFALSGSPVIVSLGKGAHAAAFMSFLREGVVHILIGIDHLAFLLVLVLPIAVSGSWRARVGPIAGIVTAFTVAHSLTLSLSALGHLSLPGKPVELLIAATVVLAAARNLRYGGSVPGWPLAYVLGLVHGFGFAGALGDLAIASGITPLAVFAFNLGVELGQLLVVAIALPVISLLARPRALGGRLVPATSLLVAGTGVFWFVQRL